MSLLRLVPGALLLAAPLLGHAQAPTPAPATPAAAPRYYVGLAAYHSNFQNLASWRQGDTGFRVPVQLTAGYQLRPRLALELGVAYSGRTVRYAQNYTYDANGTFAAYQYSHATTGHLVSVSALARYGLTRRPARRLQVDALGGLTLVHGNFYNRGFEGNNNSGTFETRFFDEHYTYNTLLLTAGLGLRYRLTSRAELNLDLATNHNLRGLPIYGGGLAGFTGSTALGLRYRLGK